MTAACLEGLLVAPLPSRADDDFSCVKDSLSANHCFAGRQFTRYPYKKDPGAGLSYSKL